MKTTSTITKKLLATLVLLVALMFAWPAAAINSNGTGGGDWNATTTWQGGVVPMTSDQAVIQSGDTVIVSDSEAFNTMSVNGILTINSTGTLTMSGAGVVSVNGTINNSGILVNSVTSGSGFAGSGTFNNFAGATVDFTADTFFPSQFMYMGWPNTINFDVNSTVEFSGTSTCNGEYDLAFPCNVLVAGGTLSSGSPLFFDGNLTYNSGTLNFSGGTETFAGTANQSISGTSEPAFNTLVVDNTGTPPGNTVYEYSGTQATTTITAGNLDVAAVAAGANNVGDISVASSATLTVTNAVANGYVSGTTLTGDASASGLVFDFTGVNPSTTAASLELSGAISGFTSADGSTITILGTGIPTGASVYQLASFATSTAPSFSTVNSPSGLTCTITTSATGITMTVAASSPMETPAFSNLSSPSITYGTTAKTLTGTLSATGPVYPANGETVTASINGHGVNGTVIDTSGDFSIIYNDPSLASDSVNGGPYPITYSYAGDASLTSTNDSSTQLTVTKATPTVTVASSENPSGFGDSVHFTATVPAAATGTVTFTTNGVNFDVNEAVSAGVATSVATTQLPRGGNPVTAVYNGDGNYNGNTGTLPTQVVTNHPPVLNPANYTRIQNLELAIKLSDLLTNGSDVDGDTLLPGYVSPSTNGTTLTSDATYIYYTNSSPTNVSDAFNYYVNDGFGGLTTNTVFLTVDTSQTGQPRLTNYVSGGQSKVDFTAMPNYIYYLQRSTNLAIGPWAYLSTNIQSTNGLVQIIDTFQDLNLTIPPLPSPAFYRVLVP